MSDFTTSSDSLLKVLCAGKYILIKKIGEGSFGEIYVAVCHGTNNKVAVKIVNFHKII